MVAFEDWGLNKLQPTEKDIKARDKTKKKILLFTKFPPQE